MQHSIKTLQNELIKQNEYLKQLKQLELSELEALSGRFIDDSELDKRTNLNNQIANQDCLVRELQRAIKILIAVAS